MKNIFSFITIILLTSMAAGSTLTQSEVTRLALVSLLKSAGTVELEGDVVESETLPEILAQAMVPGADIRNTMENHCVFINHDFIYECHLSVKSEFLGEMVSEMTISFETFADIDQKPTDLVINKARISRGD